ncbi:hypothetical protein FHG87_011905 [Trinorchestia longiramus]|nr:hypothetical protein FHG87_011905 [Trinorchestia longiramus]
MKATSQLPAAGPLPPSCRLLDDPISLSYWIPFLPLLDPLPPSTRSLPPSTGSPSSLYWIPFLPLLDPLPPPLDILPQLNRLPPRPILFLVYCLIILIFLNRCSNAGSLPAPAGPPSPSAGPPSPSTGPPSPSTRPPSPSTGPPSPSTGPPSPSTGPPSPSAGATSLAGPPAAFSFVPTSPSVLKLSDLSTFLPPHKSSPLSSHPTGAPLPCLGANQLLGYAANPITHPLFLPPTFSRQPTV